MTSPAWRDPSRGHHPVPLHPRQSGAVRRACAGDAPPGKDKALGARARTPYLHQLPPVLPKNSFFSEFQMNFFQLPSSLAFPRAMVAGQQLPRVLTVSDCGVRPRVLPGCRSASRPGSPQAHPPPPLRFSECQTRGGAAEAGAGRGGGGGGGGGRREGPRRLGGSEPRTYWWARGRSRSVFSPPRAPLALGGSGALRTRSCHSCCHWGRVLGACLL